MNTTTVPDYDLHVPTHLRHLLIAGLLAGIAGIILRITAAELQWLSVPLLIFGFVMGLFTLLLWRIITPQGRLRARHLMQNAFAWCGHEQVLDVGCGNGIMTTAVAHRLTTGKVIGIDIWDETAGDQTTQEFWQNARAEGVADRVDVRDVDARRMPFDAQQFDVIVSSLAFHHMGSEESRAQVIREIMRVLKPGGTFLLYDLFPMTGAAGELLRQNGWRVERLEGLLIRTIKAQKPD